MKEMPRYYLGLEEKPTPQCINHQYKVNQIVGIQDELVGVKVKLDGKDQYLSCDEYTVMDVKEHDRAVRQEFWDILKSSLYGMGLKDFQKCYADESKPHVTATDLFYKLTPEEIVEKFKFWKEKNEEAKMLEAERHIRNDIRNEMLRISQPVKDMGWGVKIQFFKDDEKEEE